MSKITLQSAMEQLTSMFPQIDPSLMQNVLYATKGRMERTIELILEYQETGTLPREVVQHVQAQAARQAATQAQAHHQSPQSQPIASAQRREVLLSFEYGFPEERQFVPTLDDEFLRVRQRSASMPAAYGRQTQHQSSSASSAREMQRQHQLEQVLSDNGLIPSQRQRNASSDAQSRIGTMGGYGSGVSSSSSSPSRGRAQPAADSGGGRSLGKLSEMAKKKLASFRSKFAGRGGAGARGTGTGSGSGSQDSGQYASLAQHDHYDSDDDNFYSSHQRRLSDE